MSRVDDIIYDTFQQVNYSGGDLVILQLFDNKNQSYMVPVYRQTTPDELKQTLMKYFCKILVTGYGTQTFRLSKSPETSFSPQYIC